MSTFSLKNLEPTQKELRKSLISLLFKANHSHLGSCLSVIDIIWQIYQIKDDRDLFVLSNGHAAFAWYTVLMELGYLKKNKVLGFDVHPNRNYSPHIPVSTGSLGQGLPIAVGLALANKDHDIYCLISDGEAMEGSIWEAIRFVVENNISNLKLIVSANGWSAYDKVNITRLRSQLSGFGLKIKNTRGHDFTSLKKGFKFLQSSPKPSCLFCRTQSQQLPFLNNLKAHYLVMNSDQYRNALSLLEN